MFVLYSLYYYTSLQMSSLLNILQYIKCICCYFYSALSNALCGILPVNGNYLSSYTVEAENLHDPIKETSRECTFLHSLLFRSFYLLFADQPVIHFFVLTCRITPGEISCHSTVNHFIPLAFLVLINSFCITYSRKHLMSIIISEGKSCSCSLIFIERYNCILKSTCLSDDRKCSITKTHQLA